MRNMYQCEKCGKVFADYDECYRHEERHWSICGWYKQFQKASAEFTQYSEKHEAPSVVGVELTRWERENGEVHAVAVYHLKEIFLSDRLTSDEDRERQELEAIEEQEAKLES